IIERKKGEGGEKGTWGKGEKGGVYVRLCGPAPRRAPFSTRKGTTPPAPGRPDIPAAAERSSVSPGRRTWPPTRAIDLLMLSHLCLDLPIFTAIAAEPTAAVAPCRRDGGAVRYRTSSMPA